MEKLSMNEVTINGTKLSWGQAQILKSCLMAVVKMMEAKGLSRSELEQEDMNGCAVEIRQMVNLFNAPS